MGVLVALLLLVVKQAEESESVEQAAIHQASQALAEQLELDRVEVELQVQSLESQRDTFYREIADQRSILGHLENELAELDGQARRLADRVKDLSNDAQANTGAALVERELLALTRRKETLRRELKKAQDELVEREASQGDLQAPVYSIVPVAAISGTNRRPIYIECIDEAMILHPGGIKITLPDFVLPLEAGNPLDTALLAYREYWRRALGSQAASANAYPLMVIRPSGAKWYGVARRALSGWDQEFGYELVPEDWEVDFGTPDQGLEQHVRSAMQRVQVQQETLVAMGRAQWADQVPVEESGSVGGRTGLVIGRGGGFAPVASKIATSSESTPNPVAATGVQADPIALFSQQYQQGGSGVPGTDPPNSSLASEREAGNRGFWTSPRETPAMMDLVNGAQGNAINGSGLEMNGLTRHAETRNTTGRSADIPATVGGWPQPPNPQADQANPGGRRGLIGGQTDGPTTGRGPVDTIAQGQAGQGQAGQGQAGQGQARSSAAASSMAGGAPASGTPSTSNTNNALNAVANASDWNPQSLAHQRGENWALPSRRNQVSAYHRPIAVKLEAGRLVLAAGEGSSRDQVIPYKTSVVETIDLMADAIWKRVDRWGYLGFDGYWKPILVLETAPGLEGQRDQLFQLLEGSGLELRTGDGQ